MEQTVADKIKIQLSPTMGKIHVIRLADYIADDWTPRCKILFRLLQTQGDERTRRHTAWVLNYLLVDLGLHHPCITWNSLMSLIRNKHNDSSIRRMMLSILLHTPLPSTFPVDFYNWCLESAFLPDEKPAVQALCLKHAVRLCLSEPALLPELTLLLQDFDEGRYSSALISTVRHAKKDLLKQIPLNSPRNSSPLHTF